MSPRKSQKKVTPRRAPARPRQDPEFRSERELIVLLRPESEPSAREMGLTATGKGVAGLQKILARFDATMAPLFGPSEESVLRRVERAGPSAPRLQLFYRVRAEDALLDELAKELRALPGIAGAYVKPPSELAGPLGSVQPLSGDPPPITPDFSASQGYLDPSPAGIHARYAWRRPGGLGEGVQIIDVEGAWRFTHETLLENQGGLVAGDPSPSLAWRNHGTAVLGVCGGDGIGIQGIAPEANVRAVSIRAIGSAPAVATAADLLAAGDLLLLELHRPGPRFGHVARPDLKGYLPAEWWPDDFAAIQYATMLGVLLVEVAGNGAEDLDDPFYDTPEPGFPEDWVNPFRRIVDSGAILIGAGAPPLGTHGNNHGPDRSRLGFSNYGSSLDAQAWGFEITTSGYGDLQGGKDEDRWYSDRFSGTSGASAIVTGALGCVQGALRAAARPLLTPASARHLLRTTGSPQEDASTRPATQRIGNRPNLRQAFLRLHLGGIRPAPPVERRARTVRPPQAQPRRRTRAARDKKTGAPR